MGWGCPIGSKPASSTHLLHCSPPPAHLLCPACLPPPAPTQPPPCLQVQSYKRKVRQLEDDLLFRLSNSQGNLLDDTELIDILAVTKQTAQVRPAAFLLPCQLHRPAGLVGRHLERAAVGRCAAARRSNRLLNCLLTRPSCPPPPLPSTSRPRRR